MHALRTGRKIRLFAEHIALIVRQRGDVLTLSERYGGKKKMGTYRSWPAVERALCDTQTRRGDSPHRSRDARRGLPSLHKWNPRNRRVAQRPALTEPTARKGTREMTDPSTMRKPPTPAEAQARLIRQHGAIAACRQDLDGRCRPGQPEHDREVSRRGRAVLDGRHPHQVQQARQICHGGRRRDRRGDRLRRACRPDAGRLDQVQRRRSARPHHGPAL